MSSLHSRFYQKLWSSFAVVIAQPVFWIAVVVICCRRLCEGSTGVAVVLNDLLLWSLDTKGGNIGCGECILTVVFIVQQVTESAVVVIMLWLS